ncbi:MAG: hypothetical protein MR039_02415 [Elusimicrobia bacterium]|nr:hypothetical protein [Elusimicrobiota bacterium]MDD7501565.1 hypothetical protein [Elusimicrobiota bacterium]MDY5729283.1 hypothetical protein [Elusimicrobiaceae bacterium]
MKTSTLKKQTVCDLQAVLKTVQGRRVLWRLLQAAQVHQHGFVPGDALATAFHCGQKSLGLFLLAEIEDAAPAAYAQMREEYLSQVRADQARINRQSEEVNP